MSDKPLPCPLFTVISNTYYWRCALKRWPWPVFWLTFDLERFRHDPSNYVMDTNLAILGVRWQIRYYSPAARKWYSLPEDERQYDDE